MPDMTARERSHTVRQGRDAYRRGIPQSGNPWRTIHGLLPTPNQNQKRLLWLQGWRLQQRKTLDEDIDDYGPSLADMPVEEPEDDPEDEIDPYVVQTPDIQPTGRDTGGAFRAAIREGMDRVRTYIGEGYLAYVMDADVENPYGPNEAGFKSWRTGYEAARDQALYKGVTSLAVEGRKEREAEAALKAGKRRMNLKRGKKPE